MTNEQKIIGIEIQKKLEKLNVAGFLYELSRRWKDEKDVEDWIEYQDVICKKFDGLNIQINKVFKRPFGIKFVYKNVEFTYKLIRKGANVWMRIAIA